MVLDSLGTDLLEGLGWSWKTLRVFSWGVKLYYYHTTTHIQLAHHEDFNFCGYVVCGMCSMRST